MVGPVGSLSKTKHRNSANCYLFKTLLSKMTLGLFGAPENPLASRIDYENYTKSNWKRWQLRPKSHTVLYIW